MRLLVVVVVVVVVINVVVDFVVVAAAAVLLLCTIPLYYSCEAQSNRIRVVEHTERRTARLSGYRSMNLPGLSAKICKTAVTID